MRVTRYLVISRAVGCESIAFGPTNDRFDAASTAELLNKRNPAQFARVDRVTVDVDVPLSAPDVRVPRNLHRSWSAQ